ncbi:HTTM domain-containing protein [Archangium sp.]|uniref:HTTM domain-containing protein n=1 Tax=Archangium sp. TaxID=1872627 RepID=UPI00286C7621|nr:HTTM domain-containing protein [Archangium sp.]
MRGYLTGSAVDLAVFRITVFAVVLLSRDVYEAPTWAATADAVRAAPLGLGWLASALPLSPAWTWAALAVLVPSALLSVLGLFTRVATVLAAASLGYVLAVPQFSGTVIHTHHLLWFAVLLAASPCGEALSVDTWLRARRQGPRATPGEALEYGLPLRAAWVLVGLIFLFPGLWKWSVGLDWALGGTLRDQLYWKWAQYGGWRPWLRVDEWPGVLESGGVAVMLFEPLVLLGVLVPRLRPWTVGAALLFHAATALVFRIHFSSLWACYAVFIPWSRVLARTGLLAAPSEEARGGPAHRWVPAALVAGTLVLGASVSGAAGVQYGFPFACYPTFQTRAPAELPALELEAEVDGRLVRWDLASGASQREWGTLWSLALRPEPSRLARWTEALRTRHPELTRATSVRVFRTWRAVDPRGPSEVLRRELLWGAATR